MLTSIRFRVILCLVVCLLSSRLSVAQEKFPNPFGAPLSFGDTASDDADIEVTAALQPVDARTVELQVTVTLPAGYYIYSMNPSFAGKTGIRLTNSDGLKPVETEWRPDRKPKAVEDATFGQVLEKFFDQVTWSQKLQSTGERLPAELSVSGELSGQFCSSDDGSGGSGVCKPLIPPRAFTAVLTESETVPVQGSPATGKQTVETGSSAAVTQHRSPVLVVPEVLSGTGKKPAPIRYRIALTPANARPGDEVLLKIQAEVDRPWHTFALDQDPEMAGRPTEITLTGLQGLALVDDAFTASAEPEVEKPLDDIIQRVHYDRVIWTRRLKLVSSVAEVRGTIGYQLCNAGACQLPDEVTFVVVPGDDLTGGSSDESATAVAGADQSPAGRDEPGGLQAASADTSASGIAADGLLAFLVTAAGAGFLALLTPCVFPMVPVTVAFFLKQAEKKADRPLVLATVYCLGIIGTFTILGLLVAVVFGPTKLNEFANNRWLNLGFAGLFLVFSLMLMGMFEVRLPSWLLTWSSKRESTGGIVGALFMALTFTLVSFTCTFAFVGSLLVLAARGDRLWPILGMLAFSSAFALPFFVLALFPSMLKRLPKSGGWMNTVKVTMGLVELALVLKFLSVADIGFSPDRLPFLLDTQSFLLGWIVIALVTGLYLLNMFRMTHDMPAEGISAVRCLFAILFLCLGSYIAAGVFGSAPPTGWLWQQIQAFAPPTKSEHLLDFRVAVERASSQQKLLFLDFTGVNCVNCRRMENTVLVDPEVHDVLSGLVQVQLYTDEIPGVRDAALRDELLGMNRELQAEWFGDVTLPGYAVVTPDGKNVITTFKGLDKSGGADFLKFLQTGISLWEKHGQQPLANQTIGKPASSRM